MKKSLPSKFIERIEEVVALGEISLPSYALEKDYHVLDAIRLLTNSAPNPYFRLVFCGGTCLSKAYGILQRMSEDVDFKVVPTADASTMSRSKLREELSSYVKSLMKSLEQGGFADDSIVRKSRDSNTYTSLDLSFESPFTRVASMRPHLLIELNCTTLAGATEKLEVGSLLDKLTFGKYVEPFKVECVSLHEAVAEKMVSFPRRLALHLSRSTNPDVSLQNHAEWDVALVRHLYDVHQIAQKRQDVVSDVASMRLMVDTVISKDSADFKNQHQAFAANPSQQLNDALAFAKTNAVLMKQYDAFMDDMVYADDSEKPSFNDAVHVFENLLQQALANNISPTPTSRRSRGPSHNGPLIR